MVEIKIPVKADLRIQLIERPQGYFINVYDPAGHIIRVVGERTEEETRQKALDWVNEKYEVLGEPH